MYHLVYGKQQKVIYKSINNFSIMEINKSFLSRKTLQQNKKALQTSLAILITTFFITLFISCSNDDGDSGPNPITNPGAFNEVIAQGGEFDPFPQSRKTDTLEVSESVNEDIEREEGDNTVIERFVCTTKKLSVEDGNGQFPLFNSNADVIYPGSLLQGKTLSNATPSPIVVKRAGGTISYDLNNGNLQSTFDVDEIKKSTVQDAMNNIISTAGDVVPANFQLDIIQVESQSQLALEMGLTAEGYGARVEADMSFSTENEFNRTLVKMSQSYYTMSFDLPTSPAEIFDESVTPEQLNTFVQADNPATFISSVTYGRIFYMLVESTSSRQQMEASLNIAYDGFGASAEGNLNVSAFSSLSNLKIKVIAYGGDAAGTFELAGETSITAIANKLAESTDIRAGLPLSYVVRSVERPDQIVGTKLATEYDVVECELKGILPPVLYRPLVNLFEDGIGAAMQYTEDIYKIFNKAGTEFYWYYPFDSKGARVYREDSFVTERFPGVFLPEADFPRNRLDRIGAGIRTSTSDFSVFDDTGLIEQEYSTNPRGVTEPRNFSQQPFNNAYPFGGNGIDAAVRFTNTSSPVDLQIYFSNNGSTFALLQSGSWIGNGASDTNTLFNDKPGAPLFDRVSAATFMTGNNNLSRLLFFNFAGDEMMVYDINQQRWDGPWVIN